MIVKCAIMKWEILDTHGCCWVARGIDMRGLILWDWAQGNAPSRTSYLATSSTEVGINDPPNVVLDVMLLLLS